MDWKNEIKELRLDLEAFTKALEESLNDIFNAIDISIDNLESKMQQIEDGVKNDPSKLKH